MKRIDQIGYTIGGILFILFALITAKVFTSTGATLAAIFAGIMLICYAWIKISVIRGTLCNIKIVSLDKYGEQINQGKSIDAKDTEVLFPLLDKKARFTFDSFDSDSVALQIFDKKGDRHIYIDKKNRQNLRLGKLFEIELDESESKDFFNILNKYRIEVR